jgi:hypothetical protein
MKSASTIKASQFAVTDMCTSECPQHTVTPAGRHLVSVASIDDGMRFFREYALKSVWKPIVAFRNDKNNDPLDYKTVG